MFYVSTSAAQAVAAQTTATQTTPYLGRLFYTPEQRARIDQGKTAQQNVVDTAVIAPQFEFNGVVNSTAMGSARTVWVNEVAQYKASSAQLRDRTTTSVQLPSGRWVTLKAGQSVDTATGQIYDVVPQGAVRVLSLPQR